MNLRNLVANGETMHQELGREYYVTGAGLKSTPQFRAIYDRYRDVLSDEALDVALESGVPELLEWVVDVRVGRMVAGLEERQLMWEQSAVLEVGGRRIPYLRAPIELANSPDREFRRAVDAVRTRHGARGLNEIRRERFHLEHEAVAALEPGDYVAAISRLSGIDLEALGRAAEEFLAVTEPLYRDRLLTLVKRRLGLDDISELERSDVAWLFRADRFDNRFPAERLVSAAKAQMAEMGLDATKGGRVHFDTEERSGKQPRAFCAPVRVPEEVYLVLRPRGGHNDYRTFWHELGHAMHFASPSPDLGFVARWLGDNSVTEGFAMLWDHLPLQAGWLRRYATLSADQANVLAFELAVNELYLLRRYAGKLLYEIELHRSDLSDMGARYADRLTTATQFRYPQDDYLNDVDPAFYAARYLRAWQLEAVFATTLAERFGEEWYRSPEAGAVITEWMSRGQETPAHELAQEFAGVELDFDRVRQRLSPALATAA